MTLDKEDKPLIITDGALNVLPNVKTKMHILKNVIGFSKRIGNNRPKVAVLSATEEVLDSCLLYTSPSPRDRTRSRMPSSA